MQGVNSRFNIIGNDKRPFIVAEIGINHNGDKKLALEQVYAAAEMGADSVKIQSYRVEDFTGCKKNNRSITTRINGKVKEVKEYDLFKSCELSDNDIYEIKQLCDKLKIDFHSTPTSKTGVHLLKDLGCRYIKNGSDFLQNLDLIKEMGKSNLTGILSTGMAKIAEIEAAVDTFCSTGNSKLILLHCTSSYPTPSEEVNLKRINALSDIFQVPTGLSDHTNGVTAAIAATTLGACWIEKHFTLDKELDGPDHAFSMNPKELKELCMKVNDTYKMMGSAKIGPTKTEMIKLGDYRLSIAAAKPLRLGSVIKEDDLTLQRPGNGLDPKYKEFLIGLKVNRDIKQWELLNKADIL